MVTLWYMEIGHPLCVHNDLIENNNNDLRRRKKNKKHDNAGFVYF